MRMYARKLEYKKKKKKNNRKKLWQRTEKA